MHHTGLCVLVCKKYFNLFSGLSFGLLIPSRPAPLFFFSFFPLFFKIKKNEGTVYQEALVDFACLDQAVARCACLFLLLAARKIGEVQLAVICGHTIMVEFRPVKKHKKTILVNNTWRGGHDSSGFSRDDCQQKDAVAARAVLVAARCRAGARGGTQRHQLLHVGQTLHPDLHGALDKHAPSPVLSHHRRMNEVV